MIGVKKIAMVIVMQNDLQAAADYEKAWFNLYFSCSDRLGLNSRLMICKLASVQRMKKFN